MRTFTKLRFHSASVWPFGMGQACAGAKPDQVHRLSEDLTPMGSERAGNADGTIPEWTGGITTPPAGYSPGDHHPTRCRMTNRCSVSPVQTTRNMRTS